LVPYVNCPIQTDAINQVIQKVMLKAEQAGLTPYQPKSHTGFIRHLVVRHGLGTGEMLLAFVTREAVPSGHLSRPSVVPEPPDQVLPRIAAELKAEVPALSGVVQNINPARTNVVLGTETRVLAGSATFLESFDNLKLRVSLHSFLQVNTSQAAILHTVVREALGYPEGRRRWATVLDLYSGIGTLALAVSDSADYVIGVEEVGAAVEDARENARLNQKKNL
jgi:23S rRNA (uracil1939-C5)-methyltransferase